MKYKVHKKACLNMTLVFLLVLNILLGFWKLDVYALNPQEEQQASSIASAYARFGEEHAYNLVIAYKEADGVGVSSAVIQKCVDAGAFPNHVEDLKALGYTDVDYSAVSGSSGSSPAPAESEQPPAPEPETFTVEDMEDTPMWATQTVNYREGASTDYDKIGSLEQDEQVIVNGVASTGWYRFNTADGTEAYVSDNYLTAEEPTNNGMNVDSTETEQEDTDTIEETDTEVIEDIEEEPEAEEAVPEEAVEPIAEVVEEPPAHSYAPVVVAVVCVIAVIASICYAVLKKKRSRG